jgi:hypothetical protein
MGAAEFPHAKQGTVSFHGPYQPCLNHLQHQAHGAGWRRAGIVLEAMINCVVKIPIINHRVCLLVCTRNLQTHVEW